MWTWGPAGEHHEHQLGVCGPMGGLRWAVFRAPQYERACIADIKHQSCRYCCRTWFWGRFEPVPMAPKHEKGNTTGDHDAADARVRRARALYAGERQSERRRPCRPLPPGPTIKASRVSQIHRFHSTSAKIVKFFLLHYTILGISSSGIRLLPTAHNCSQLCCR